MVHSETTFAIVCGAWHAPEAYSDLTSALNDAGYVTVVPRLASLNSSSPERVTCTEDVDAVRSRLLSLIDDEEKDVVVVCHSYGGIPGGGAARGLSKEVRAAEGRKGGVIGIIYMCAFVVPEGSSLLVMMGGQHAPYVLQEKPTEHQSFINDPEHVLYPDVPHEKLSQLVKLLEPTSMHAFDSPAPAPAWAEPAFASRKVYLRCTQDQALPPFIQDMFMDRSGTQWIVKDLAASHSPFVSKPQETAQMLVEAAEAFSI